MLKNTLDNVLLRELVRAQHKEFEAEWQLHLAGMKVAAEHEVHVVTFPEVQDGIRIVDRKHGDTVGRNSRNFIPDTVLTS